ncbi:MAG: hypothetical protein AMXMBFR7_09880 [Planctomycetota bacterium]
MQVTKAASAPNESSAIQIQRRLGGGAGSEGTEGAAGTGYGSSFMLMKIAHTGPYCNGETGRARGVSLPTGGPSIR